MHLKVTDNMCMNLNLKYEYDKMQHEQVETKSNSPYKLERVLRMDGKPW